MSDLGLVLGKTLELKSQEVVLEDGSKRSRPTQAMSLLGDMASNKNPVPHPLAYIDEDKSRDPMDGFDKGHIIARQFIGNAADKSGNIVPLEPTFNRSGLWKQLELALHAEVKKGKTILLQVEIEYLGADSLIPSCLVVSARDQGALEFIVFNGIGLKRVRFVPPIIAPIQMTITDLQEDYGADLCEYIVSLDSWFAKNIDIKTYDSNKELFDNSAKMGPFGYPRPYQCLDFAFTLVGKNAVKTFLGSRLKIQNGLPFHARQRDLMNLVNRIRNNGWLVSDDSNDVIKGHLAVGAGADAGHVDHIHPKAQAGSNAFSNARLISRKHNETTKDTQKMVTF